MTNKHVLTSFSLITGFFLTITIFFSATGALALPTQKESDDSRNIVSCWLAIPDSAFPDYPQKSSTLLDSVIREGSALPAKAELKTLVEWARKMEPGASLMDNASKCAEYREPLDSTKRADVGQLLKVHIKIGKTNKYRQLKVKLALAENKYSTVEGEIDKLLHSSDGVRRGYPVLISYLVQLTTIRSALESIRECLHWKTCPPHTLTVMRDRLSGLDMSRDFAARAILGEYRNFLLPSLKVTNTFQTLVGMLRENLSATQFKVVYAIVSTQHNSFDYKETVRLANLAFEETAANANGMVGNRGSATLKRIKQELLPLELALQESSEIALPPRKFFALQSKMRRVSNLAGKMEILLLAGDLDTSREGDRIPTIYAPVKVADELCANIEGTRILVGLNLYERDQRSLPDSLDKLVQSKYLDRLRLDPISVYDFNYSAEKRSLVVNPKNGVPPRMKQFNWIVPKAK